MGIIHSDQKSFYVYKYIFLLLSLVLFGFLIVATVNPDLIGGNVDLSLLSNQIILLALGIVFFILFLFIKRKMILVAITDDKIKIKSDKKASLDVKWEDIKFIKPVLTLRPPLYVLSLKDQSWYLFSTGYKFININGVNIDLSKMKDFIKKHR